MREGVDKIPTWLLGKAYLHDFTSSHRNLQQHVELQELSSICLLLKLCGCDLAIWMSRINSPCPLQSVSAANHFTEQPGSSHLRT
jgi:hypothetical protein